MKRANVRRMDPAIANEAIEKTRLETWSGLPSHVLEHIRFHVATIVYGDLECDEAKAQANLR